MKLLILCLLFTTSLSAQSIPLELPSASNVNSILFREMRSYMFQVFQRSQAFALNDNCRLVKYDHFERPGTQRELKVCLSSNESEDRISQELRVFVFNKFAGTFKYIQSGPNVKALSFKQMIRFQYPETSPGTKTEFYFDHFTFGLINDRTATSQKLDAFLQIRSLQLNFFEDKYNGQTFRNYTLSCGDCEGVTWLKVQADDQNVRYFTGSNTGEVTPTHFNQMLSFFVITPLSQLGLQFRDKLIEDLNWPIL